jgi:type IV pilus assembly protein PilA
MGFTPPPPAPPRQGLAIASLVIGILSVPTLGCLGLGALLSIVFGIMALVRAGRDPGRYGGRGFAIGGIVAGAVSLVVGIPLAGIVAAIAIPSLLRARVSANEAAAIGDLRTVISAEMAYQSVNCNSYGRLECLSNPKGPGCIVDYPAAAPTFLDPVLSSARAKSGYQRTFHPGAEMSLTAAPGCPGGTGLESFAYTAEPVTSGQTGVRGFCGDASGVICFTTDGSAPPVTNGRCAEGCTPLF